MNITLSEGDFRKYFPSNAEVNSEFAQKYREDVYLKSMRGYLYNHPDANLEPETVELFKKMWIRQMYHVALDELSFQLKNGGTNRPTSSTTTPASVEEIERKLRQNRRMMNGIHDVLMEHLENDIENYEYKPITTSISGWYFKATENKKKC